MYIASCVLPSWLYLHPWLLLNLVLLNLVQCTATKFSMYFKILQLSTRVHVVLNLVLNLVIILNLVTKFSTGTTELRSDPAVESCVESSVESCVESKFQKLNHALY